MTAPAWQWPLLGLDVSEKRIGLALADRALAPRPLFTYYRRTRAKDLLQIAAWVRTYEVGGIVLGLPLNMDGTAGPRASWITRFANELRRHVDVPVLLQDERLSTVEADELLQERGLHWQARAEQVDAVAAALILERFLTETGAEGQGGPTG